MFNGTAYADEAVGDPEAVNVDLKEVQWYTNADPTDSYDVELDPTGDSICTDRGASYARYNATYGRTRACWRWGDQEGRSGADKDEVHCGRRNSAGN